MQVGSCPDLENVRFREDLRRDGVWAKKGRENVANLSENSPGDAWCLRSTKGRGWSGADLRGKRRQRGKQWKGSVDF